MPETISIVLAGGRGGGKTIALLLGIIRFVAKYGANARVLLVRRTYPALLEFEDQARTILLSAFPGTSHNRQEHTFRFPNGAVMVLGYLDSVGDFDRYQGSSFGLVIVDEAGQFGDPSTLMLLRSCLRAPDGIPTRMILAANPGGPGHAWLASRFVLRGRPWRPFVDEETDTEWVLCPSTYRDNPHLDRDQYEKDLRASAGGDEERTKAWLDGDWNARLGHYFATDISQIRNQIDPWPTPDEAPAWWKAPPKGDREVPRNILGEEFEPTAWKHPGFAPPAAKGWQFHLSYDHGTTAPAVCYVMALSPGAEGADGRYYPADSVVLLDEYSTASPDKPGQGKGYVVPRVAEDIRDLASRWGLKARGVGDDAMWQRHGVATIADEFSRCGVHFDRARKADRLTGWERMRRMLQDAGKPDVPGLYVTTLCRYWWATVPMLPRDPLRPDDLDTRAPDHAADATRYGLFRKEHGLGWAPLPWGGLR